MQKGGVRVNIGIGNDIVAGNAKIDPTICHTDDDVTRALKQHRDTGQAANAANITACA